MRNVEVDLPSKNIRVYQVTPMTKGSRVPTKPQPSFIRVEFTSEGGYLAWAGNVAKSYDKYVSQPDQSALEAVDSVLDSQTPRPTGLGEYTNQELIAELLKRGVKIKATNE